MALTALAILQTSCASWPSAEENITARLNRSYRPAHAAPVRPANYQAGPVVRIYPGTDQKFLDKNAELEAQGAILVGTYQGYEITSDAVLDRKAVEVGADLIVGRIIVNGSFANRFLANYHFWATPN